MAKRKSVVTGATGEHYVAYKLSAMGFVVAVPRGNSPAVDLLVATPDGSRVISIQVKTSTGAWRDRKRKPADSHWEFEVGRKAAEYESDALYYAMVDLRWGSGEPDVFLMPSKLVAEWARRGIREKWTRHIMWIYPGDEYEPCEADSKNRWDLIKDALS